MNFGLEPRSFRQPLLLLEEIAILPREIPIFDEQQRFDLAAGKHRGHPKLSAQIMRVSAHAYGINRHRQGIGIADDEILFSRRNVEAGEKRIGRRHLDPGQSSVRGFAGKIKADEGFFHFRFSGGMEMVLDDKIGLLLNTQRQAVGEEVRLGPESPASQGNAGAGDPHPAESRLATLLRPLMHTAVGIAEVKHMMHHRARRGPHVNGRDPFVFCQSERNGDVAIDIRAIRRHVVGGGHFDDEIGLAELPAGGEFWRRLPVGCPPFGHPLADPILDEGDLIVRQPALVPIGKRSSLGLPGRHES